MSLCSCDFDSEHTIDDLGFNSAAVAEHDLICEDCGASIPAGTTYVLYSGIMGECDCYPEEGEECSCGGAEPWEMNACAFCHHMRQDLQEMGYCIPYPGLENLIESMEEQVDLKDMAIERWGHELRAIVPKRFLKWNARCAGGVMLHSFYGDIRVELCLRHPKWVDERLREIEALTNARAENWRRVASCEEA